MIFTLGTKRFLGTSRIGVGPLHTELYLHNKMHLRARVKKVRAIIRFTISNCISSQEADVCVMYLNVRCADLTKTVARAVTALITPPCNAPANYYASAAQNRSRRVAM